MPPPSSSAEWAMGNVCTIRRCQAVKYKDSEERPEITVCSKVIAGTEANSCVLTENTETAEKEREREIERDRERKKEKKKEKEERERETKIRKGKRERESCTAAFGESKVHHWNMLIR
jgi:hypothetical protein